MIHYTCMSAKIPPVEIDLFFKYHMHLVFFFKKMMGVFLIEITNFTFISTNDSIKKIMYYLFPYHLVSLFHQSVCNICLDFPPVL